MMVLTLDSNLEHARGEKTLKLCDCLRSEKKTD